MTHEVDLAALSARRLLRLYADILTELVRRGVVRSRNAPAGGFGEHLVHRAYGGELGGRSQKSWDVRAADGRLLQVKTRLLAAGDRGSHVFSPVRPHPTTDVRRGRQPGSAWPYRSFNTQPSTPRP